MATATSLAIDGLAYVAAFLGPLSAGPIVGVLDRDWRAVAIGLPVGIAITFLNAWLSDKFMDPWIARFQVPGYRRPHFDFLPDQVVVAKPPASRAIGPGTK